jgi:hypothetical protein
LWRYSPLAALPPTEISGGVLKNAHRVLHQNFCKSSKNLTRGLRFPYGFLIIFLGSKPQENKKNKKATGNSERKTIKNDPRGNDPASDDEEAGGCLCSEEEPGEISSSVACALG